MRRPNRDMTTASHTTADIKRRSGWGLLRTTDLWIAGLTMFFFSLISLPISAWFVILISVYVGHKVVLGMLAGYCLWILMTWAGFGAIMRSEIKQRSPWPDRDCAECGYLLTGNTTGQCPECGCPMTSRQRKLLASRYAALALKDLAKHVPRWLAVAITPGAVATSMIAIAPAAYVTVAFPRNGHSVQWWEATLFAVITSLLVGWVFRRMAISADRPNDVRCLKCHVREVDAAEILCSACLSAAAVIEA